MTADEMNDDFDELRRTLDDLERDVAFWAGVVEYALLALACFFAGLAYWAYF